MQQNIEIDMEYLIVTLCAILQALNFCVILCQTRMHSSRMHTAHSLTVSLGILRGVSAQPPWIQTPQMQSPLDADPPFMQTPWSCDQ